MLGFRATEGTRAIRSDVGRQVKAGLRLIRPALWSHLLFCVEIDELLWPRAPAARSRITCRTVMTSNARHLKGDELVRILPRANVVKIGAQSLIDRGRSAVFPVIEELAANVREHQLIIGVGAGTRARHAYDLGSRLGLPTGLLAALGGGVSEENAMMIAALMAPYNAVRLGKSEFAQLPMCLAAGSPVVVTGSPPFRWWEPPPAVGRLPEYRTDSGVWLIAEAFGARSMIYLKDVDGLYTDDPKKNADATFIPKIGVSELIERDFDELVIERKVLEMMRNARWARQIQVINALVPGNITRALAGEHVGSIITADD